MTIHIEALQEKHAEEVLAFELENRAFFESVIPPRPDTYYTIERLKEILKELEEERGHPQRTLAPKLRL